MSGECGITKVYPSWDKDIDMLNEVNILNRSYVKQYSLSFSGFL